MPTVMLRQIPGALVERIKAFGRAEGLGLRSAILVLVSAGLEVYHGAQQPGRSATADRARHDADLEPRARDPQAPARADRGTAACPTPQRPPLTPP